MKLLIGATCLIVIVIGGLTLKDRWTAARIEAADAALKHCQSIDAVALEIPAAREDAAECWSRLK